jgi:7,8-dihydropterin-6-yl-methyl-4-(beta-D-ribofuranosyl)aminobenzene 5'-phosphate synthase
MKRRDFLKGIGAAGVSATLAGGAGVMPGQALAGGKVDIGQCKSVRVDVLSETSWFDNAVFKKDIMDHGGAMTNQYQIPWHWDNAGAYMAKITVTSLEGNEKVYLMDTGWNNEWVDYIYEEKSDMGKLLESKEVDTMILSHFHLDHYWGIGSTLKRQPDITMWVPATHFPEDLELLKGGTLKAGDVKICSNGTPFKGEFKECTPEGADGSGVYKLQDGMAVRMYDVPILLRVRGENVLYFNVKDKGVVTVTGCCHPGILTLNAWARRNLAGYQPYGCYGGLHISLFEDWKPKYDDIIKGVKAFKLSKVGCNHCTGWIWAERAAEAGVPIVKGTDEYKSYKKYSSVAKGSNVFLTNGDHVIF